MNDEIKRILKLSNIPGFKISAKEKEKLDAWKAAQEPVKAPKKKRTYKKKKQDAPETVSEPVEQPSEVEVNNEPIKVQNIVTMDEKALNEE